MDGQSAAVPQCAPDHARLTAHYGWVHAVARNLVRDPWGAEDVTQETLLAALAAPPRDVADDQRLRAWLGRVAFNLSRLGARQGSRRHAREVRVARREALPSVTDELESAGTLQALSSAIAALDEPYRGVVLMRYFDGLSTAEIAARTHATELAVRKRLWRARNKLRAALDHDPVSGRLLAGLFSWSWSVRRARAPSLCGLAAGLALVAGATWWGGQIEREVPEVAVLLGESARGEVELAASMAPAAAAEPSELPPSTRSRVPMRRPVPPAFVPEPPPTVAIDEARLFSARGIVLDLAAEVRAGFELFEPRVPVETLGTSDALGAFALEVRERPERLEARAPGWTTIVPARFEADFEPQLVPIVVAAARDLEASVHAEFGGPIAGARFALRCDESTFARIPYPVRLESALLRTFQADERGRTFERQLPRGAGLTLCISAPGFEPLQLDTLELGGQERFFLRALGAERVLAGRVLHRDGRPAAGATVSLALATTSADALGRYRLPLRGVRPESSLGAWDPYRSAAPFEFKAFGARVATGAETFQVREADLVLGEEHDLVAGKLVGDDSGDWLVVAYPRDGARLDAQGNEEPAAMSRSAADGSFTFRLPRGAYDLHAIAPAMPLHVRREALESEREFWEVALPESPVWPELHAQARTADGFLLAGARIELGLRLQGELGPRRIPWRALTSDERGSFGFACDPAAELELLVVHAAVGRQGLVLVGSQAEQQLIVPRSSFLQVAGSSVSAVAASVLDAEGRVLAVRGPLRSGADFALRAGWSPVLEVPRTARWLELQGAGPQPVRVPIEPRPGELLQVRP